MTTRCESAVWMDREDPTAGPGYCDGGSAGVEIGTRAEKSLGKSAYFRHRFTTGREFIKLDLRGYRDDTIIVYRGSTGSHESNRQFRFSIAGEVGQSFTVDAGEFEPAPIASGDEAHALLTR